jgi:hypothetical protein
MEIRKLAAVIVWIAASGGARGAEEAMTVMIFDQAGTPRPTLELAADAACRMFHIAGIETNWCMCIVSRDPNEHCLLPPAASHMQAMVVPNRTGGRPTRETMALALTIPGERPVVSYVFSEPARALAERAGRSFT